MFLFNVTVHLFLVLKDVDDVFENCVEIFFNVITACGSGILRLKLSDVYKRAVSIITMHDLLTSKHYTAILVTVKPRFSSVICSRRLFEN